MRVSVVIPACNAVSYLGDAVESVLDQTFGDWELVIVDDGSEDRTAAVARAFTQQDTRIRLIQQDNTFIAGARNRGMLETTRYSEYVSFLDADDVWERDALAVLVSTLQTNEAAVAAYGLPRMIDHIGKPCSPGEMEGWSRRRWGVAGSRLAAWPVPAPTTFAVLAYENRICAPGQMLIRRSVLEGVGPFDPASSPMDDWDMWLRLSLRGDIAMVDRVVLNWRSHQEGTRRRLRQLVSVKHHHVRRKLLSSRELSPEHRHIARVANLIWSSQVCSHRLHDAGSSVARGRLRRAAQMFARALRGYGQLARGAPVW